MLRATSSKWAPPALDSFKGKWTPAPLWIAVKNGAHLADSSSPPLRLSTLFLVFCISLPSLRRRFACGGKAAHAGLAAGAFIVPSASCLTRSPLDVPDRPTDCPEDTLLQLLTWLRSLKIMP